MSDPTSEVHAPIVASVWRLHVEAGQTVAAGETIAILESMKMEIPVHTDHAGVVLEVPVTEGQIVQEGDVIARLGQPS